MSPQAFRGHFVRSLIKNLNEELRTMKQVIGKPESETRGITECSHDTPDQAHGSLKTLHHLDALRKGRSTATTSITEDPVHLFVVFLSCKIPSIQLTCHC